ncbi:uncharacterized protein [Miscanthus floridulus]|uniref:uncharacterized protein n=1 Tax=Miscanthus floridulus TaxID=154761 RepID=UPI00345A00B2
MPKTVFDKNDPNTIPIHDPLRLPPAFLQRPSPPFPPFPSRPSPSPRATRGNSPSIRPSFARRRAGFAPPRADLTAALRVAARIRHEGGQIQGRRQGQTALAPESASPPPPPPCSSLPQLERLAQSLAGARAAPLQCAPGGGGSSGARRATRSSPMGSCSAPPQPEPAPLSPDAVPFSPSAGRSKSMRWDEISLTDDEDERSPSPYLEAARRALAQPASAGAPPTVDSASLHAARTGEIEASPGDADRRARASADRTAGATSPDGADATSPARSF